MSNDPKCADPPLVAASEKVSVALLRWFGGKWRLADWIIGHFPPHQTYTEAFAGAASVLLRKPRARAEIINDLDGELVNFFQMVRDCGEEMAEKLALTPFARAEFAKAYRFEGDSDLERARKMAVRSFMGFGNSTCKQTGFKSKDSAGKPAYACWVTYPEDLAAASRRLRGVVIESRPALEILAKFDEPGALHYIDPPYLHGTRGKFQFYRHEMTEGDHEEMLRAVCELQGAVAISGYQSDLYRDYLRAPDWRAVSTKAFAEGARSRTEWLWLKGCHASQLTLI